MHFSTVTALAPNPGQFHDPTSLSPLGCVLFLVGIGAIVVTVGLFHNFGPGKALINAGYVTLGVLGLAAVGFGIASFVAAIAQADVAQTVYDKSVAAWAHDEYGIDLDVPHVQVLMNKADPLTNPDWGKPVIVAYAGSYATIDIRTLASGDLVIYNVDGESHGTPLAPAAPAAQQ